MSAPELHRLKIDPEPMDDLLSGAKTGEVRNDDRGFRVGDCVHLTCADGRETDRIITHIQRGYGLPDGLCVLSYRSDLCASGQQVRALVWEELDDGKAFRALLPIIGSVRVEPYGCCDWWEVLWSMPGQCDKLIPDVFNSADAAKAAAQADYERRILSALMPAPQPDGMECPRCGSMGGFGCYECTPQPAGEAPPTCVACEDNPKHPNIPRAFCGAHPTQPSVSVAEALREIRAAVQDGNLSQGIRLDIIDKIALRALKGESDG